MRTEHRQAARSKRAQQMALAEDLEEVDMQECADLDEDCAEVPCKTTCWLYAPEEGRCPFLEEQSNKAAEVPLVQRSVS